MGQIESLIRKWKEQSQDKKEEGGKSAKDTWIIITLLGILLLIIFIPVDSGKDKKGGENNSEGVLTDSNQSNMGETEEQAGGLQAGAGVSLSELELQNYAGILEKRLEEALSCMEGAGRVKVMVTLASSEEAVVEKDVPVNRSSTEETDAQGGSRSVTDYASTESTIYGTDGNGNTTPYVVKRLEPKVEGVVVIAQGGGNEKLCKNITEVIQALFGIEAHKIKVVKMKITS